MFKNPLSINRLTWRRNFCFLFVTLKYRRKRRSHIHREHDKSYCYALRSKVYASQALTLHFEFLSEPSPLIALPCQWLSHRLALSRLEWCNPGKWRCQLSTTSWSCQICRQLAKVIQAVDNSLFQLSKLSSGCNSCNRCNSCQNCQSYWQQVKE